MQTCALDRIYGGGAAAVAAVGKQAAQEKKFVAMTSFIFHFFLFLRFCNQLK